MDTLINSSQNWATPRTPWRGKVELVYTRQDRQTCLSHAYTQAPLRVQRPHYPEGREVCYSTIVHTAGGMVGGDELEQHIHLQPDSQVLITTPAAGKIYRSIGPVCRQQVTVQIDQNADLEWFPQETIIFNGAQYQQQLRFDLAPGARVLLWDITRFGRTARGEAFVSGGWRSDVEVWRDRKPLLIDRQGFVGSPEIIASPHGLNGYPVVGMLALVGQDVGDELLDTLRETLKQTEIPPLHIGLTRGLNGLICRYRGESSELVRRGFVALWQVLRQERDGRVPPLPRVWY